MVLWRWDRHSFNCGQIQADDDGDGDASDGSATRHIHNNSNFIYLQVC